MDWSLVLASQEIESTIAQDEAGWALLVQDADHVRAVNSITLYRKENRGWHWRQKLPGSGVVFHWGSILWCLCIIWIFFWSTARFDHLKKIAFMDNRAVALGEWWRIFTAITLHADLAHLSANATTGFVLIGLAMARFGPGIGLMAAYLAGAGGNVAGYFLYDQTHHGLGASGMVMGALGLLVVQGFSDWRKLSLVAQLTVRGLAAGTFLFILMGTNPGTDVVAHLGGFCFGMIFAALLSPIEKWIQSPLPNRAALIALPLWVLFTWYLVFKP